MTEQVTPERIAEIRAMFERSEFWDMPAENVIGDLLLALDAATAERDTSDRQCADAERFANDLSLRLAAAEAELARLRAQVSELQEQRADALQIVRELQEMLPAPPDTEGA